MGVDLTVAEVAERWRCSQRHVLDLIRSGRLNATKPGRRYLVAVTEADRFKASTATNPAPLPRRRRRAS